MMNGPINIRCTDFICVSILHNVKEFGEMRYSAARKVT